jgi:hypothetical protein
MTSITHTKPAPVESHPYEELAADSIPWIGFVFVAGPPLIFLAVPLVVFALSLIWAFPLLFALVAAVVAVMAVVGLAVALVAVPYVLIRRALEHRTARATTASPRLVAIS